MIALVRAPESATTPTSDADIESDRDADADADAERDCESEYDCERGCEPRRGDDARRAGVSSLISERVTIVTGRSVTIVRGCATAACGVHSRIAEARSDAPSRH